MRNLVLLLLVTGILTAAFSQHLRLHISTDRVPAKTYPYSDTVIKSKPGVRLKDGRYIPFLKKMSRDSSAEKIERLKEILRNQRNTSPINRMPNAITVIPFLSADLFKRNNGEGFSIYESGIDRMSILKPDSTNDAIIRKPGSIKTLPNSTTAPKIYHFPGSNE